MLSNMPTPLKAYNIDAISRIMISVVFLSYIDVTPVRATGESHFCKQRRSRLDGAVSSGYTLFDIQSCNFTYTVTSFQSIVC